MGGRRVEGYLWAVEGYPLLNRGSLSARRYVLVNFRSLREVAHHDLNYYGPNRENIAK